MHDLVAHGIEDGNQRRTGQDGVGQVQRIRIGRAQRLEQTDHVIAEDPEQAGGHRRQLAVVADRSNFEAAIKARSDWSGRRRASGDEPVGAIVGAARQLGLRRRGSARPRRVRSVMIE
jgi:hypothetical protein